MPCFKISRPQRNNITDIPNTETTFHQLLKLIKISSIVKSLCFFLKGPVSFTPPARIPNPSNFPNHTTTQNEQQDTNGNELCRVPVTTDRRQSRRNVSLCRRSAGNSRQNQQRTEKHHQATNELFEQLHRTPFCNTTPRIESRCF